MLTIVTCPWRFNEAEEVSWQFYKEEDIVISSPDLKENYSIHYLIDGNAYLYAA